MKYKLTNNKITIFDKVLYQIIDDTGTLGGFVTDIDCVKKIIDGNIDTNTFIFNSVLEGEIYIHSSTIVDSHITGSIIIEKQSKIINSNIKSLDGYILRLDKDSHCIEKDFSCAGTIDNRILEDEYFEIYKKAGIKVIKTKNHIRINCQTFTYKEAYKLYKSPQQLQQLLNKYYKDSQWVFSEDIIQWIANLCKREIEELKEE